MTLEGKFALVTGASRGIGREIALELARQGANVAVNFAGSEAKANEVVDEIKALGKDAFAVKCNVANSEEVSEMFAGLTASVAVVAPEIFPPLTKFTIPFLHW